MQADIEPAAERVGRRVFPCLQAVAVGQVVRRLPKVVHLVAVLDGRVERGVQVGERKDGEDDVRRHGEAAGGKLGILRPVVRLERVQVKARLEAHKGRLAGALGAREDAFGGIVTATSTHCNDKSRQMLVG